MMHIDADRAAELARSPSDQSEEERSHLLECGECKQAVAGEQAFGQALRSLAWPTPSASFVALTQARFAAARRARQVRHQIYGAILVTVGSVLTLLLALTAGLVASKQIVLFAVEQLTHLAVAINLASTLMGRSTLVPLAAALICTTAVVVSMGVIARTSRATVELERAAR